MSHFRLERTLTHMGDRLELQSPVMSDTGDPSRSDAALVADALRGDRKAYESLVRRYERLVRATGFAVLKDWHAAQDVAQESFLAAYMQLGKLRNPGRFGSWILTIAHNRAVAASRSNRRHQSLEEATDPISAPESGADAAGLFDVIAQLPDHERVVVMLRYIDGHDVNAIARIRASPVGTITKQLSRAHRRLQKMLAQGERR
jgi:RNA polymerase sigma-70 factor (ECF subfamily)